MAKKAKKKAVTRKKAGRKPDSKKKAPKRQQELADKGGSWSRGNIDADMLRLVDKIPALEAAHRKASEALKSAKVNALDKMLEKGYKRVPYIAKDKSGKPVKMFLEITDSKKIKKVVASDSTAKKKKKKATKRR